MGEQAGGCQDCSRRDALRGLTALAFTWVPLGALGGCAADDVSSGADAVGGAGGSGDADAAAGGGGASVDAAGLAGDRGAAATDARHAGEPDARESPEPDARESPEPDARESPEPDGGNPPDSDGGNAPDPDGGNAPDPDGGNAANPDGGNAPDPDGGNAPDPDGGNAPDPDGGSAPDPDGGNAPEPDAGPAPDPDAAAPPPDASPPPDQCQGNVCIDLSAPQNAGLSAVGGSGFVQVGNDSVIVVHQAADTWIAVSGICTHRGCRVVYNAGAQNLRCPCHNSLFALDGAVQQGPANRALVSYENEIVGTTLVIYVR